MLFRSTAKLFTSLFGWEYKPGPNSIFNGAFIEVMKKQYLGVNGHIGIRCNNTDRARAYFEKAGYTFRDDTMKFAGGQLKIVYFTEEVAGFALHLVCI